MYPVTSPGFSATASQALPNAQDQQEPTTAAAIARENGYHKGELEV